MNSTGALHSPRLCKVYSMVTQRKIMGENINVSLFTKKLWVILEMEFLQDCFVP